MSQHDDNHEHHGISYGGLVLVWLGLLALTSVTVSVAGISLGQFTLFVALGIAALKSMLVINYFMHIKFDEPIFKVFIGISGFTLVVIFLLTYFDISFR
ncbi:MAG: cytochrome C oxidase subunit IV family protein [Ignavibacteria bacterium]|jgi:cytochrome c oxidase subunit 4